MVKKSPDLERGESTSQTDRIHIPPRLFKEAVDLNRLKEQIVAIVFDTNLLNKKAKIEELEVLLDKYIPGVEAMRTKLKKYDKAYKELSAENAELEKMDKSEESIQKKVGNWPPVERTGRTAPHGGRAAAGGLAKCRKNYGA